jgi:CRP-like cAMP-binding protein
VNPYTFTSFLSEHISIDPVIMARLEERCKVISVEKGGYLLEPGQSCRHTFFVQSGLLRQFTIDEKGKEHILQFAPERWFVSDREAVFGKGKSVSYIQALEPSTAMQLDEEFIATLSAQTEEFAMFNIRLLQNHIRHLQRRLNLLLSATAEERYLDFIAMYPDIMLRVPQSMVASYLGITPESLSRVRKDLAHKNFKP